MTVMTQNHYLRADLTLIVAAPPASGHEIIRLW
jgi:hypothetical protein